MTKFKIGVLGLVGALLLAFGAFGLQGTQDAQAHPVGITGPGNVSSGVAATFVATFNHDDVGAPGDAYTITTTSGTLAPVSCLLDEDANGTFETICTGSPATTASDATVEAFDANGTSEQFQITFTLTASCTVDTLITITATQSGSSVTASALCQAPTVTPVPTSTPAALTASNVTVTANPATIEVFPATGSSVASVINVLITDSNGNAVVDAEVVAVAPSGAIDKKNDFNDSADTGTDSPGTSTLDTGDTDADGFINDCEQGLDTTPLQDEANSVLLTSSIGIARFVYCARAQSSTGSAITATLGKNTITIIVHQDLAGVLDVIKTIDVTVVGPPAALTISASPTTLRCGEKATITGSVKDAAGQTVSPNTPIQLVTNFGGVIASGAAGFGGIGTVTTDASGNFTSFLLTSSTNQGPYEVVAGVDSNGDGVADVFAQVTVTCSAAAAATAVPTTAVTVARTGQGISAPNTGDAGLAGSSSSGWTLFAIGGMAAFALAGLATLKFARR